MSERETESAFKSLQDDIFLDKVQRAKETPMSRKFMDGLELFDMGLVMMRSGIRHSFPDYDEEQVQAELRRRLAIGKRLDDGDRYTRVEADNE